MQLYDIRMYNHGSEWKTNTKKIKEIKIQIYIVWHLAYIHGSFGGQIYYNMSILQSLIVSHFSLCNGSQKSLCWKRYSH